MTIWKEKIKDRKFYKLSKNKSNNKDKNWKVQKKKVDLDASLDQIPNSENGVNTRNGSFLK